MSTLRCQTSTESYVKSNQSNGDAERAELISVRLLLEVSPIIEVDVGIYGF